MYEITSRKQPASRSSKLSRAYCAPVVRSSIKIPTEISHSLGILIPTGDRSDRGVVRHANVAEFPRAIFLPAQFQRRTARITWKRARGLTANDKANVILSALRARYRGRSRGSLEPCLASKHRVECSTINLGIQNARRCNRRL